MKINFSTVLCGLDGQALKDKESKEVTLVSPCVEALLAPHRDESDLSATDKFRRYQLAQKIFPAGVIELGVEEVAQIKTLVAKFYAPLIVGRVFEALDPLTKD